MLKLQLQYFGHLMWKADSLEKPLMLVKIEDKRRRGQQRMRWLDGIPDSMDVGLSKLQEMVKDREAWHSAVHGVSKNQTWVSDWTTKCFLPTQGYKFGPQDRRCVVCTHFYSRFQNHLNHRGHSKWSRVLKNIKTFVYSCFFHCFQSQCFWVWYCI